MRQARLLLISQYASRSKRNAISVFDSCIMLEYGRDISDNNLGTLPIIVVRKKSEEEITIESRECFTI